MPKKGRKMQHGLPKKPPGVSHLEAQGACPTTPRRLPGDRAIMQLHLTVMEKEAIQRLAKGEGVSPSMWIRRRLAREIAGSYGQGQGLDKANCLML